MVWKRYGLRSRIVEAQCDLIRQNADVHGRPEKAVLRLRNREVDQFTRNPDGSWTHRDLVTGRTELVA